MTSRPRVALTLLAALFALAFPAAASAVEYEVDSPADEPALSSAACLTAGGNCTLRAAIEAADATTAVSDEITFDDTVFEGQAGDTITPATALPAITSPVEIKGGACTITAVPLVEGPCVGVSGPSAANVLTVEADGSAISGLAVTGGAFGINVSNATTGFIARGDWIGLPLDQGNGGNSQAGIFLDPDSNGAVIGGTDPADRNVFAFNVVSLDIMGADEAVVRGNYFSVKPDGSSPAPAGTAIEITDSTAAPGFKAENNEIGAVLNQGTTESAECDGGCNVISGSSSTGIDLNGSSAQEEAPASGPTFIRSNFIGLDAAGTAAVDNTTYVGNGFYGIQAGGADEVTVGGYPLSEANYVVGGSEGIVSENGEDFIVRGNRLGVRPGGAELAPPGKGVFALDQSVSEAASIEQNIVRAGGVGIEQRGATGHITGNEVLGGSTGIFALGEPGGGLIAGNYVEATSEYGVLVESPNNDVRENTIVESGAAGIRVKPPTGGVAMNGTSVGGSTEEKENVIEGGTGPAIEIFEAAGEPGSTTEITLNSGSGNAGLFIDLVNGANEGIAPPTVATALLSSATGTALPGAKVRVFSKASAEPGELQGFLAEATADGSGNWKATYPTVPAGTLVTATQTNENSATSELATPVAAVSESSGGGGGGGGNDGGGSSGGGNNNGGGSGTGKDTVPPDTKIVKAPPKKTHKTTVKFKFTATEGGSTFQCKLDGKPFKPCRSPKTYKKLKPGKHVFRVRAIDKAGNMDPTPAKRKFTVLK